MNWESARFALWKRIQNEYSTAEPVEERVNLTANRRVFPFDNSTQVEGLANVDTNQSASFLDKTILDKESLKDDVIPAVLTQESQDSTTQHSYQR